ncbi:MAG: hypothetical protein ACKVOW_14790 [Chitinophagaceae bacterium]
MKTTSITFLVLTAVTIFAIPYNLAAQLRKPLPDIIEAVNSEYIQLKKQVGTGKKIPLPFEKQVLFALSYFPELAQTPIRVKLRKSKGGIISTRPTLGSIFRRSSKRSYIVIINDSTSGRLFPIFSNGSVNGQVGILGHEFCHILYFRKKTGLGLMGLGIAHISKRYMDNFENKTDSVAIERGLGYQLIDWNVYLQKAFRLIFPGVVMPFEKSGTRERYMSIPHIKELMSRIALYQN